MNIAVIGGGTKCAQLLNIINQHQFKEIHPKVVGVADLKSDAPGLLLAKAKGLFTTNNYEDLFARDDIDLIIELTGNTDIINDILEKKGPDVRAISSRTAQLFWEIARVSTKQKKTRQELYEANALYKTMINELIQEDVLVIGHDYRIIDVNNTVLNRLGLKREEVVGKFCYEITHRQSFPCSGKQHPCPLLKTMETIEPSQTTHIHRDKNNKEIYYSISTYPLIEDGDIFGVVEISRDITGEINVQKAMMQQEKLASIGRLSAGVAHEINNPLTTILTTSMLLQEETQPEDPMYAELETIAKETLRCRKIVTSLLDFARQTKPDKKEHNLNDIIKESLLLAKKQAAFKDVSVEQDLASKLPRVLVDKGQIQQSLINLVLNAIAATSSGGYVRVLTRYVPENRKIHVAVADNGEGISENNLIKIFDPFFTTKDDGSGLGLAITHGIIEQHNGSIEAESKLGHGTTFTIKLPLAKDNVHEH
ncbi:MAG: histidine kinase [Deltaproteobacteria bacterium]|nr:MAG: histidine kinase [Deltaproteobacteria bacterium]RLC16389.1 MAG: histidine kinase [Deltaproteobacteria bacterium]